MTQPSPEARPAEAASAITRVDAHHHVWDLSVRPEPWIDPATMAAIDRSFFVDDLAPHAAAAGISSTVVVQTVSDRAETREFLALAASSDLVEAVTGWVDLTSPTVAEELADLRAGVGGAYLRGIRHQVQDEPDPEWLNRPEVRRGLVTVADDGLVYELLTKPAQLPAALRTVAELPEVRFVLDHCSKPPIADGTMEPWAWQLRQLAALPNVTCKLSGLVTEAGPDWTVATLRPYVEVVLEAFGPERLMFGSDWPVCLLGSSYARWVETVQELLGELSLDEQAAIWGGTARRVYALA